MSRIFDGYEGRDAVLPKFSSRFDEFSITFTSEIPKETAPETRSENLTDTENKILGCLKDNGDCTSAAIAEFCGISTRTVSRVTGSLSKKGLIIRVGSDRDGYWKIL